MSVQSGGFTSDIVAHIHVPYRHYRFGLLKIINVLREGAVPAMLLSVIHTISMALIR